MTVDSGRHPPERSPAIRHLQVSKQGRRALSDQERAPSSSRVAEEPMSIDFRTTDRDECDSRPAFARIIRHPRDATRTKLFFKVGFELFPSLTELKAERLPFADQASGGWELRAHQAESSQPWLDGLPLHRAKRFAWGETHEGRNTP